MKNIYFILVALFCLISCKTDNFYETERYFLTDKETYQIGDDFELTVEIVPEQKEKEIRFYDNYKNLRISFSLINEKKGIHNGSWTKRSDEFLKNSAIKKYKITRTRPFRKTFIGKISESESEIIIEIPELSFKEGLPKSDFDEFTKVRIHGHCNPISPEFAASLEEFIEVKDIRITNE